MPISSEIAAMSAINEPQPPIGDYDDFLMDCLESGAPSRLALLRSLCDRLGRYDFRSAREAECIVRDFCKRHAPGLSVYRPNFRAGLTKALVVVVLSVLGYYRAASLISMVPKPYKLVLCSVVLAVGWLFCVLGSRIRARRLERVSGTGDS